MTGSDSTKSLMEEDNYKLVMSDNTGWERIAAEIRRLSERHE